MSEMAKTGDTLPDIGELEELAREVLREASARGATTAEAGVSFGSGLSVTARLGEVETVELNRDRSLGVTVYFGQRKGSATTSDWSRSALEETVAAACGIARYTSEDDCAGLADPELMATEVPDLDLYHPWPLSAEQAIEMASECEAAARDVDSRIVNSEGATVHTGHGLAVYGNSHGFIGGYPSSRHSISCSVIGQEGESMQRDYWYSYARDRADLQQPADVGKKAGERTVRRLGARKLATCQVPVVFAAELATGLMGNFVAAISGSKLYRKSSFLVDHLDKQVFPEFVTLTEQPHLKKAIGSAPFDNEGVATHERVLVEDGILRGYVLGSYSARKLGMRSTANAGGVHNLIVEPGSLDQQGLLREMGTGLLVTEVMGQGINYVNGDYSRGAAGFWVENGEIQYPVEEITIAGNLKDMFMGISAIGNDVDKRGNVRTGSILIDKMTIAGE